MDPGSRFHAPREDDGGRGPRAALAAGGAGHLAARAALKTLRSILFTCSNRPVPSALLWLLVVLALAAALHRDAFFSRPAWPNDGHAALSLHLAVADAQCGKKGRVSSGFDLAGAIAKDRRLVRVPLPDVIREVAGSLDVYCASVDREALNNENSLMLVMTWALKIAPRLSPGGLARVFGAIRFGLIAVFGFAMLLSGASVVLVLAAMLIATDVLQDLRHFQYTIYPFLAPIILGLAGLYVTLVRFALRPGARDQGPGTRKGRFRPPARGPRALAWWQALLSTGLGLLTAFFANMRSSHLPVYVLFFLAYAVIVAKRDAARSIGRAALTAIACFALGYAAFTWLLIRPLTPSGPHSNMAHHVIAHPLVLALAVPPNDLSRREGIVWSDEAGLALARREIPDATYLGPDYERALFRYYRRLWREHPGEMIGIYWSKLAMAGKGMLAESGSETEQQSTARALSLPGVRPNGVWLMLLYVGALAAAFMIYRRRDALLGLLFALLAAAAVALMIEAAIIMPTFRLMYHAYLLIVTALLALAAAQCAADALSARTQTRVFTESQSSVSD
jgi:hypothetical protein